VADAVDRDRHRIVAREVVVLDDDGRVAPRAFVVRDGEDGEDDPRSFLGVRVEEETELSEGGARVVSVIEGSPAEKAGIEDGDVIVGIDGHTVRGPMGLRKHLDEIEPGARARVEVIRDGQTRSVTAELGEAKAFSFRFDDDSLEWDSEAFEEQMEGLGDRLEKMDLGRLRDRVNIFHIGDRPKLGVELVATTPELREHLGGQRNAGVLVGRVMEGMPAADAGIQAGDLIEAIDGEPVGDVADLVRELRDADGTTITLDVVRDRRQRKVEVTIPERDDDERSGPRAGLRGLDLDDLGRHIERAIEEAQRAIDRLHEEHGAAIGAPLRPAPPAVRKTARIGREA
jgi:C-terminal processing protease CtpA/Prc